MVLLIIFIAIIMVVIYQMEILEKKGLTMNDIKKYEEFFKYLEEERSKSEKKDSKM